MSNEMEGLLPSGGADRWWKVTHNPKSRLNPITVTLMECTVPGRKGLSRAIGFEHTIAEVTKVKEAAEVVLARVADYPLVIGEYHTPEARG